MEAHTHPTSGSDRVVYAKKKMKYMLLTSIIFRRITSTFAKRPLGKKKPKKVIEITNKFVGKICFNLFLSLLF